MDEIKKLYDSLLDSGELFEMFPEAKGEWTKDKKFFTTYYEDNQKIINDDFLNIDDEEENLSEGEY
jgi:hypothetical protein